MSHVFVQHGEADKLRCERHADPWPVINQVLACVCLAFLSERKPHPSDVSDNEGAFVAPYRTLIDPEAPQREHSLLAVLNGLRYILTDRLLGYGVPQVFGRVWRI